jgi:FixJ family two-component response regulator
MSLRSDAPDTTIERCPCHCARLPLHGSARNPLVIIIDDDASVRAALHNLFRSVGLRTELFGSTDEFFLQSRLTDVVSCLVLEVRLPGMSGIDFQLQLAETGIRIPVVFVTGYGDIPMAVRAMKAGAFDFLTKPFRDQDLLDAVTMAISHDRRRRDAERFVAAMQALFETLSPREREVMTLVASGLLNKQVAARTGLAEATVKIHRKRVMRKMGANSLAELVRMTEIIGIHLPTLAGAPQPDARSIASIGWSGSTRYASTPMRTTRPSDSNLGSLPATSLERI